MTETNMEESAVIQTLKKRIQQLEEKHEHDWNAHYRHIMELLDWYKDNGILKGLSGFLLWVTYIIDKNVIVITDEELPELVELIVQEFKGEI